MSAQTKNTITLIAIAVMIAIVFTLTFIPLRYLNPETIR